MKSSMATSGANLAAAAGAWVKHNLRDGVGIGYALTLAVLAVGGGLGYTNARQLADDDRKVAHTHEVIESLEALLSTLKDAETGQRGYLLAEDEKYLKPYDDALRGVQGSRAAQRNSRPTTPNSRHVSPYWRRRST